MKKNYKVLIVEDEKPIAMALEAKLMREGFSVSRAKNGQEGLETAIREHPNIILLDIIMPKMGGLSMLKELRKDKWGKRVPVIILTNLSDNRKVAEAVNSEAYSYLVKSDWKIQDVVKKIKEKLLRRF